jgi:ADP-ribose pyrophosphatase YjhB (NUDIX family)
MVQTAYPDVFVEGIRDIPGEDSKWSTQLDSIIRTALPHGTAILYGGRDSFIAHYSGTYQTAEVATAITDSGTQLREDVRKGLPRTAQAREGVIWAAENRWPCGIATVDMVPYREGEILLGRRTGKDEWRMLGGFFDPHQDTSLEAAACRELHEEAPNLECDKPEYVGSFRVNDPRYDGSKDKIITALFAFRYLWGDNKAGDDIAETRWFKLESLPKIAPEHVQGIQMLLERKLYEQLHTKD